MRILAAVLFAFATTAASWAPAQDLPIRVGRIAHIEGQASLYQDPEAGWERAYINSPVTSENSVWTDDRSRAEVRVSGMAIRLDYLTQLDVARLDEDELDAYVARGSVAVRVRHHENTERLVFNTPNARVRLRANGRYRIDVDPERLETRVTVFTGEARIGAEDGRMSVSAGRSVVVFGAEPPEFVEERVLTGAFDRWTLARDERWREGRSPTYVSTYMTGYEDLDAYGQWVTEPDYGALWYPRQVAADWAPYRYGHWDYVYPWGWTWIDDAPWGYAPFHYGRWVYVRDRWGWVPGERVARPVWAPALVAWVGGSNWSVGVSSGPSLGWYPLSPWDRYQPWFQASPTYVQRVNVIVRSEPTRPDRRQWRERTRERGMTIVDRRTLIEQQPVQRSVRRVSTDVIRQVQAAPQPQAILPTRNDVIQRRRERPQQVAAPRVITQAPAPSGATAPSQPSAIVRPSFGRNAVVATPRQSNEQERQAQRQQAQRQAQERLAREQQQAQQLARERQAREQQRNPLERGQRDQQQAQERQAREQQQAQERAQREQQQAQRQQQERAQREQQQAQERQAREQQQAQRQQQERAQREQQQAQERQAREQQQAQRQQQERAQREQQQAQERQAREQQQAQRQQQERAQREQQQAKERQAREQQQAQRQQQERAQREQQQAQERQAREQQQAQRQQQERAQREQQQAQRQAQERAQREQQQAQERAQREQQQAQRQAQERAQREQQQAKERQAREQQQAQRQAQERAQREQQQAQRQAQERAQREQQQAQERAQAQQRQAAQQAQAQAQQAQRQAQGKGRDKDDDDEEKGKGKNR